MENLNKTSNNLQGTFPASEASLIDIIGTKVETDENGAITKGGWEKLNNTLEMYSDKRYETARYLFVKDSKIVRHVAVSSKTPASTAVKPDDDFLLKLRTYAEQTDSEVIFIHNHPSGYVMPSENDVNLTKYLESVFIDNGGKARFLGHAILDHGNYGLYTKKSGWAAMTDGEIKPLSDLDKNYSSDEKNYGLRIKGKEELVALAEKAKSLDSLEIWNKQDWIPVFFASASKIVKSHDYIGNNEFTNARSLAEKLKSIGRNHNSENVYFFPSSREQQLQCEAFAQTTGLVANIVFRNEDGNFELSDYSGGTLFSDTRAKDISVEDTDSLDRSEIERKLFETADNNTNETLSTQAKKDGNMKNTQTIEKEEAVPELKTHHRLKEEDVKSLEVKKNHIAANFVLEKLAAANIEVITDKGVMREILESGKLVQKMAAFHGTGGTEKSFNGYGTYVVSVNEGDAKQIGMKVASKKYGDAFYVKGQAFETFLKEHKFSPYWAELLKQSRLDNVEELQSTMMLSDAKGNAELERQKNELSTLFKYGLVEHKREKAFVYSIDIPDNNGKNYLPYESPIGLENAEKINGALEKLGTQWRVTRNDGGRQVYFNTLSEKVFGGSQEEASKFLRDAGLVGMRMNDKNYIVFDEKDINVNKRVQFMTDKNGEIYGFAHEGKIYLDPDLMNANTPAHEYTHLWDAYTRQTNPDLWEKGKDIFRQTRLWNEVKGDPNYADIADDEDLVLSEVHARICGDIAQKVLERVAEQDGEIARDRAIDWDKEVAEYVAGELGAEIATPELGSESYVSDSIRHEVARNFLAQPMKDLVAGKEIALEREQEKSELYKENEAELKFIVEEMLEENLPELQKMAKPAENKKDPMQTQQGLSDVQGTPSATSTHIRHQNNIVEIKSQEHFAGKFGALANEIGNSASPMQPGEFLDRIKKTFDMDVATETTGYVFSREDGTSFKLRVANHKAVLKNRTGDKTEMTSVVIQLYDKRGQDNNKARLSEFIYFPESLDKETQLGIVSGIKDWISSHEYTDRNYDQMYVSTARALRERLKESEQTIQKMATLAKNAKDIAPSARGLSEERETAERLRRAAATDYDDPIEAKEAWHNGTEEEREAIYRAHAARPRNAPSADDFVRITAESADAGLFADMRDEMGNDPLAGNTPETLSVLRNIERLAVEARNGAETGRLAKEFVASLEESGIRLYKSGRKNLLRMLDIRNLAAENRDIPETVPIGEAGSFFWNGHNIRTDGEKSSYDLIAEAHSTAYRRLHAKEEMRKILAENDYELTEADTARLSGAGFRSMESLGDIGKLAAEIGKEELFRKIGSTAFRREEAVEKLQAGEKVEWIEERKSEKQKEPQQEKNAQAAEQAVPEEATQKEVAADPQQDENSLPSQMKEMKKMMEEQNRAIRMLQEKLIQTQKENSELHQTISMLQVQGPRMDEESQAHERSHEEGRGERPNSETQHLKNIDGFSSETAFNVNQKIPKFGKFSEETKKIEINDGCVFQKYIEHPTDKSMDKILYLDPKHTRINENGEEVHTFEMSAREYQKIINASEKYEARKLDMKNDYDWLYANEEYQTALKIDYDKFRRNTAANFFHNIRVSFRASGCQNIDDAMKCARDIVAKMTPYERKRFNEQRNEYGAEKFDQMLIKHFTNNRLELTEEELARLEVERKENKDSLLEQIKDKEKEPRYLQNGETIGETKTTVGSDLKIALHMTGFDGKRIKTPVDDFKIVKVTENFRPDKAILYSKKMKSSYTIPLATLEGYIKEMEQIRGKMEKVKAKSEKVEKNLLKRKEKRLTLDTGRVGR